MLPDRRKGWLVCVSDGLCRDLIFSRRSFRCNLRRCQLLETNQESTLEPLVSLPIIPWIFQRRPPNFNISHASSKTLDVVRRPERRRTLLFSEGLAVQVKPEASSPWRSPGALSGGQVALVGLALNLATQAVRPAPLYLMDEVRGCGTSSVIGFTTPRKHL